MKVLSVFLVFFKIKEHRVTFVSLTTNTLEGDFKAIVEELKQKDDKIQLRYIFIKFEKNLRGDFLYMLNCFKQLFLINTSKVVIINDNNYVISNFKRKGVCVIQLWHACGAVKQFGNQIKREYVIQNYDYIISTSPCWQSAYSEAFHVPKDHVVPLGLPRCDALFHEASKAELRKQFYQQYPELIGKNILLYAPTFRGNIIEGFSYDQPDFDTISKEIDANTVILYKMHPLLGDVKMSKQTNVLNMNHIELNKLLCVADCLISDYSSVIFDFTILLNRIILYAPDLKDYKEERGLNVTYEEMPGCVCQNTEELLQAILTYYPDKELLSKYKDHYFTYQDGKAANRIAELIRDNI